MSSTFKKISSKISARYWKLICLLSKPCLGSALRRRCSRTEPKGQRKFLLARRVPWRPSSLALFSSQPVLTLISPAAPEDMPLSVASPRVALLRRKSELRARRQMESTSTRSSCGSEKTECQRGVSDRGLCANTSSHCQRASALDANHSCCSLLSSPLVLVVVTSVRWSAPSGTSGGRGAGGQTRDARWNTPRIAWGHRRECSSTRRASLDALLVSTSNASASSNRVLSSARPRCAVVLRVRSRTAPLAVRSRTLTRT